MMQIMSEKLENVIKTDIDCADSSPVITATLGFVVIKNTQVVIRQDVGLPTVATYFSLAFR